jgi:cyclopropane fatty-acyl-phospholipid synthase-like methyltransferase
MPATSKSHRPAVMRGLTFASRKPKHRNCRLRRSDIDGFFAEARRVLKPGGVLAIWCYEKCSASPACDKLIRQIFAEVEQYWPPERKLVDGRYEGIDLPVTEFVADSFRMQADWTADNMLDYMRSWSASQHYLRDTRADPTENYSDELRAVWRNDRRTVLWPITLRMGRR